MMSLLRDYFFCPASVRPSVRPSHFLRHTSFVTFYCPFSIKNTFNRITSFLREGFNWNFRQMFISICVMGTQKRGNPNIFVTRRRHARSLHSSNHRLNKPMWRKRCPGVECTTLDPKVVGSNPICAEIGLHVFYNPQNGHEYWSICSPRTQSSRMT